MKQHSWVHLACHALQSLSEPSASAFHLHGSQLTLEAIVRNSLEHAELAFLSACQTAKGDDKLPEEAVHLAAGMIMAGYSTVIATMWSIKDEDAPVVAASFYSHLLEGGRTDSRKAARALHDAVARLRTKVGDKNFARWVPFIHMGQ
jgi:CHAT domain-containing protein